MDAQFWINLGWIGLALVHIITPFVPFAWPLRALVTMTMAARHNWPLVVLVADGASTIGLVAQYYLFSWLKTERLIRWVEQFNLAKKISDSLQSRMFIGLVGLNISPIPETLLPLVASAKRYSIVKFAAAMFLGRLTHIVPMALGGAGLAWLWKIQRP